MKTKYTKSTVITPDEFHPGWNAFHYFNHHYRQTHTKIKDKISTIEVREAWNQMDDRERKPFQELQKSYMTKYRPRNGVRKVSANSLLKQRLSLLEYKPKDKTQNWNTWASQVQKQLIKHYKSLHPELKTIKEATCEWRTHWLALKPPEQTKELKSFFKVNKDL